MKKNNKQIIPPPPIQIVPTKNYQFDYYYFPKYLNIQMGEKIVKGYYYVQLRLDTKFMDEEGIRALTGFLLYEEIPKDDFGVSIESEKTFHCVATKGLAAHVGFTLIPVEPRAVPDPQWNSAYNTRLTFVRNQSFDDFKTKLCAYIFISPVAKEQYRADPKSVKLIKRKGDK